MTDLQIKGLSNAPVAQSVSVESLVRSSRDPQSLNSSGGAQSSVQSNRQSENPGSLSGQIEARAKDRTEQNSSSAVSLIINIQAKPQVTAERLSYEQALNSAQLIADSLNEYGKTKVQFQSEPDAGPANLRFQVIDAESGKVVREFPPEVAESLAHRLEFLSGKPLLRED